MLAHTLGNPFDLASVKAFCEFADKSICSMEESKANPWSLCIAGHRQIFRWLLSVLQTYPHLRLSLTSVFGRIEASLVLSQAEPCQ